MEKLTRYFSTRAESLGDRKHRFIISDETLDRHNSIIKMAGWRLKNYEANGVVAYQHLTWTDNPDLIVGKGIAFIDGNRLIGEVELEPKEENEIAGKLDFKIGFGSIKATSVGFFPYSWSWGIERDGEDPNILYFRDQDLLEWSICNIGSNPAAVIEKSLGEFVDKVRAASGADMPPTTLPPTPEKKEIKTPTPGPDRYTTDYLNLKFSTL